jgi:predicted transcriptional regulator
LCYSEALPLLQELSDRIANKIILSTIENAKTAYEISLQNGLPLSSTYRKIRKLQELRLLCIEKVQLDNKGKKVFLYRSKIRSLKFLMKTQGAQLQFEENKNT